MLSQFRALAKTPVAKVLFFILGASFVLWGIRGVAVSAGQSNAVVKAGSRTVDTEHFRQMFESELKQYGQQSGQPITVQDALAHNADRQIADAIASDEAFAEYIRRAGVQPADKLVVDEIHKAPRFFNPVSGLFDRQSYEQFVHQIGMTAPQFEDLLRDQLAQTQFVSGVAAAMRAPLLFSAVQAAYSGEGRDFSYLVLGPTAVTAPAQPTEAQLQGFMKQNAAQLMRPEARVFTLLRFSTALQALKTAADPAAVQKRFDFEKDTLSTPEKRTLVEIPARTPQEAAAAVAKLNAGAAPDAVAADLKVQPLNYAATAKTAIADRKVADAAFAMTAGQVQGPVQGDLGLAVLKLLKVDPGHPATLDEVRPKIEAEVKHDAAQALVDQQVRKYEDARSGGADLLQAAKAVGAETKELPGVTAQGSTLDLQPKRVPMPPKLLEAGFALKGAGDTDLLDLGQGEYAALHLVKVIAPAPPPLDDVRPLLVRYLMQRDLITRLNAKAEAIATQVKKGQTLQAAAAGAGVPVSHAADVPRTAVGQTFSNELLSSVFAAKPGEVISGPDVKLGVLVARVERIVPASGRGASQIAVNQRRAATQATTQDLAIAVRNAARDSVKPTVDYKRARNALGGGDVGSAGQ